MPSRLLREGILNSDRIEQLDAAAEVFYRRLMSKVDDHGLYDARPSILRASLYPLRVDRVREADISRWIAACEKAGLIALYAHEQKPYLQMLDTRWIARSEPKFPLRTLENTCVQPGATVPVVVVGVVVEDGGGKRVRASPREKKKPIPEDFGISERVQAWATENGYAQLEKHLDAFKRKAVAKGYAYVDWDSAFMEAVREDWAKLRGRAPNGAAPPPDRQAPRGPEPALLKLAADAKNATKPPAAERERWAALKQGAH
jgi:hypothetical protein